MRPRERGTSSPTSPRFRLISRWIHLSPSGSLLIGQHRHWLSQRFEWQALAVGCGQDQVRPAALCTVHFSERTHARKREFPADRPRRRAALRGHRHLHAHPPARDLRCGRHRAGRGAVRHRAQLPLRRPPGTGRGARGVADYPPGASVEPGPAVRDLQRRGPRRRTGQSHEQGAVDRDDRGVLRRGCAATTSPPSRSAATTPSRCPSCVPSPATARSGCCTSTRTRTPSTSCAATR